LTVPSGSSSRAHLTARAGARLGPASPQTRDAHPNPGARGAGGGGSRLEGRAVGWLRRRQGKEVRLDKSLIRARQVFEPDSTSPVFVGSRTASEDKTAGARHAFKTG